MWVLSHPSVDRFTDPRAGSNWYNACKNSAQFVDGNRPCALLNDSFTPIRSNSSSFAIPSYARYYHCWSCGHTPHCHPSYRCPLPNRAIARECLNACPISKSWCPTDTSYGLSRPAFHLMSSIHPKHLTLLHSTKHIPINLIMFASPFSGIPLHRPIVLVGISYGLFEFRAHSRLISSLLRSG